MAQLGEALRTLAELYNDYAVRPGAPSRRAPKAWYPLFSMRTGCFWLPSDHRLKRYLHECEKCLHGSAQSHEYKHIHVKPDSATQCVMGT